MPTRPLRRTFLAGTLLPLAAMAAGGCSFPPTPSVRPGDVTLAATLHRPGTGAQPLPGASPTWWTLVVSFSRRIEAGAAPGRAWADEVLPVVPGTHITARTRRNGRRALLLYRHGTRRTGKGPRVRAPAG